MGPLRTGFFYGIVAVVIAVAADLYYLFVDPAESAGWVPTVLYQYHTQLALSAFLFLGILAALRTHPERLDAEVPYRSLLLRDCVLAATVVAVMAGTALLLLTAVQATLLASEARDYAHEAAPKIASYVNESREELSDPPPPAEVGEVRASLQPPVLRDLGRSLSNLVLRGILIGATGGIVGALRGRSSAEPDKPEES